MHNGLTAVLALILGTAPLAAQLASAGVSRLDSGDLVVLIAPDQLDGVHVEFKARPAGQRFRFDPKLLTGWADSAQLLVTEAPPLTDSAPEPRSSILRDIGGVRGILLQVGHGGHGHRQDINWRLDDADGQPVVIRATSAFSASLLNAMRRAAPLSRVDSVAFAAGLVEPLLPPAATDSITPLYVPMPHYPPDLQAAGVDGLVYVRFLVTATGVVEPPSVEALWASAPDFIEPTRDALTHSSFRPAQQGGIPVRRWVYETIRYRIAGRAPRWQ